MTPAVAELAAGAVHTLGLFAVAWICGLPLGLGAAFAAFFGILSPRFLKLVSFGFAAIPLLVVLFWVHYPLQAILDVVWPAALTASAVLVVFVAVSTADALFDSFKLSDARFGEMATVLGLQSQVYARRILVPNGLQIALPRLLIAAVSTIHLTMFASLIGVEELFRVTLRLNAQYLKPVELFSSMALFYIVLCGPLYMLAMLTRQKLTEAGIDA